MGGNQLQGMKLWDYENRIEGVESDMVDSGNIGKNFDNGLSQNEINRITENGASDFWIKEINLIEETEVFYESNNVINKFIDPVWDETRDYTVETYPEYDGEIIYESDYEGFESYELEEETLTLESLEESIRYGIRNLKEVGDKLNQLYLDRDNGKEIADLYGFKDVSIDYAISIYEQVGFSGSLSLVATEIGVEDWENGKSTEFNYDASRNFLASQREGGRIEKESLGGMFDFLYELEGLDQDNKGDRKKLTKILGFNPKNKKWCAAIVKVALKVNGFVDNMDDTAASALGFMLTPGAHVGISDGMGNYMSGNIAGGQVAYSRIDPERMYGWILPEDNGQRDKVHWASEGTMPPAGAIVVVQQGTKDMPKIRKESGRWPN